MAAIRPRSAALVLATAAALSGIIYAFLRHHRTPANVLTLYGNIDIREVELAFNGQERVTRMLVQEGDYVHPGQLVAELETARYAAAAARAERQVESQRQVLARLLHGSRPEEIVEARARMRAAQGTLRNAEIVGRRVRAMAEAKVAPPQQLDDAEAALKTARGNYNAVKQQYLLAVKGSRVEDIEAARALLKADEAALALARRQLKDTRLYAPADGIIEDRILEPGDMASPSVPVFTMALANPLWVRAYVAEADLGRIYPGMLAAVGTDSFPGKVYQGWVGYISPAAEFTPKTVETPELRARLVYQVRIYVCNPQNELRLGMPATVTIQLSRPKPAAGGAQGSGCNSNGERDGPQPNAPTRHTP